MREKQTLHVLMMNFGAKQDLPYAHETQMFVGSVVVANDYFKTFSAGLRSLVGGRMIAYKSLLDPNLGALSGVAQWQQTHPMTGDRIRRLQNKFKQKGWLATGKATPLPDAIGCENFRCE